MLYNQCAILSGTLVRGDIPGATYSSSWSPLGDCFIQLSQRGSMLYSALDGSEMWENPTSELNQVKWLYSGHYFTTKHYSTATSRVGFIQLYKTADGSKVGEAIYSNHLDVWWSPSDDVFLTRGWLHQIVSEDEN